MEALLADLRKRGIHLWLEGERLRYTAPQGALTPELRAQLQARKPEIVAHLLAHRTYPPSFVQRRFWTLQQLNPEDAFYNVPFVFRLRGPLDTERLRESFNAIVRRHDSLRTTLEVRDGELTQVVAPAGEIDLTIREAESGAVKTLLQAEMERPFDLAHESGFRVLLLQLDGQKFILQLCFHNTVFDQSSVLVLLKQLSLIYTDTSLSLPPPAQYFEYVAWQESLLASAMDERLKYWRDWFAGGDPPQWTWTPHKLRPTPPAFHSHVTRQLFSPELTGQLKELSRRNGVTLYIVLLTAYAMLLRHYTGCDDITIGTTYSNRDQWQFNSLIGATIDVPALRIQMGDNPSLTALLDRVRSVVTVALTYQDVPFERIAPSLGRTSAGPLFRVVFSFFPETPHGQLQLPGIEVTFLEEEINELSRPDLYLVLCEKQTPAGDVLSGYWMHKQDAFEQSTAVSMNEHWHALLGSLITQS